jgi:thiol-disulfide isomerase/thioredoxin
MVSRRATGRRTTTKKRKGAAAAAASTTSVNVRSEKDVPIALNMLKKAPVALVLVYANWCPHCHTYMPFWEKLAKTPGRNVPMIAAEQTAAQPILDNIMQNGRPITVEGYPTVIEVKKSPSGANTGTEVTQSRNEEMMTNMVVGNNGMAAATAVPENPNNIIKQNTFSPTRISNIVPNNKEHETLSEDVYLAKEQTPEAIASQMEEPPVVETTAAPVAGPTVRVGGSLYESLVTMSAAAAPAAALLLANEYVNRRRRGTRNVRKTRKTRKTRRGRRASKAHRK